MSVTNGLVNLELNTVGYSGSNCRFKLYLFKDGNRSFSAPEAKENRNDVNVVYTAKKLTITSYETEVTDGVFNATVELAGLDTTNSTYELWAGLYSSDNTTRINYTLIPVTNGLVNLELNTVGYSGSNCRFKVYLFKDGNRSFSAPEAKESKSDVTIS